VSEKEKEEKEKGDNKTKKPGVPSDGAKESVKDEPEEDLVDTFFKIICNFECICICIYNVFLDLKKYMILLLFILFLVQLNVTSLYLRFWELKVIFIISILNNFFIIFFFFFFFFFFFE
jgi:hypothetical protein